MAGSARFYEKIFGFRVISDFGGRGCALQAGDRHVLLLFKKGGSVAIDTPHDGEGELHLAFAISAAELPRWDAWLFAFPRFMHSRKVARNARRLKAVPHLFTSVLDSHD